MSEQEPLLQLLRELKARRYSFTTVTPATHARLLSRSWTGRPDLRDIFGWNRPFAEEDLDGALLRILEAADAIETCGDRLRSKVRISSLHDELFLHSAYPTNENDAVFFGPDTYRFARFLRQNAEMVRRCKHVVDMGAGSGAGGIVIAKLAEPQRVTLLDLNPRALRLAAMNAAAAGVSVELLEADAMPEADAMIANPPYMIDAAGRAYRDGGDLLGGAVALDWVRQGLQRLSPGGAILLYTGAAYVDGKAPLIREIEAACSDASASLTWQEIDPDVFGEELAEPAYHDVERIAAIGAVIVTAVSGA